MELSINFSPVCSLVSFSDLPISYHVHRLAHPSPLSEMMERPYYMDYSSARLVIHKMVTSKYFDLAISAVIGLNVITMAMEFYMMPDVSSLSCPDA